MASENKSRNGLVLALLIGLIAAAVIFIYIKTFADNDAGVEAKQEVFDMIGSISESDDPVGSEVFIAIAENAGTDKKLSEAELTALRFEYKKYIEKRDATITVATNENNDIKGKQ